ncbi:hypothetical protein K461DRAFT_320325 [Myriangium duriaei CBS 260.36]|uniref:Uncharacterized protein n=1 Tax=Myriangium duriaei CBS 260.36 TaxID=1168546 RepID=A0A9P4J6M4_9PEZI|nr:hypothetical protein K461DRAFT_320325 [Myriangium duriaei CBS 260.36]
MSEDLSAVLQQLTTRARAFEIASHQLAADMKDVSDQVITVWLAREDLNQSDYDWQRAWLPCMKTDYGLYKKIDKFAAKMRKVFASRSDDPASRVGEIHSLIEKEMEKAKASVRAAMARALFMQDYPSAYPWDSFEDHLRHIEMHLKHAEENWCKAAQHYDSVFDLL